VNPKLSLGLILSRRRKTVEKKKLSTDAAAFRH
jgi:hypothetical protein